MHINRILVRDFGPFIGEHVLELPRVAGIYGDNMAGKSTIIVDAILTALFGTAARSRKFAKLVNDHARSARVQLNLSDGTEIAREWTSSGQIYIDSKPVRHGQDTIHEIIGVAREDLESTQIFTQGDAQKFAGARPAERRRIVSKWVARAAWKSLEKNARERLKVVKKEIAEVNGKLSALEPSETSQERIKPGQVRRARKAETVAQEAYDALSQPPEPEALQEARVRYSIAKKEEKSAEAVKEEFDGVCPITDGKCPVADDISEQTDVLVAKYRTACQKVTREEGVLKQLERGRRENLREYKRDKEYLRHPATKLRTAVRELENAYAAQKERERLEEKRQEKYQEAYDTLEDLSLDEAGLTYIVRMFSQDGIPADEVEEAIGEAEHLANSVILDAIGVPYRIAFQRGKEVKSRWANFCKECGAEDRKGQYCGRCNKPWHKAMSDELHIMVDMDGQSREFNEESGGCRDGAAMAIRFAFARQLGNLNLAVCDEVFRQLDVETQRSMASFLFGPRFQALGFDQVLCISHDPGMLAAAPNLLQVTRGKEGSTFQWNRGG